MVFSNIWCKHVIIKLCKFSCLAQLFLNLNHHLLVLRNRSSHLKCHILGRGSKPPTKLIIQNYNICHLLPKYLFLSFLWRNHHRWFLSPSLVLHVHIHLEDTQLEHWKLHTEKTENIFTAISMLPPQASSKFVAISFDTPVTAISCSTSKMSSWHITWPQK